MKNKKIIAFLWLLALSTSVGFSQKSGREYEQAGQGVDASKLLAALADDTVHQHIMMPMRDGIKLATEVFIPLGNGPWPVVLVRTPYGRLQPVKYAKRYKSGDVVFVTQDPRGTGDSEGNVDPVNSDNEIEDGYDCVEWIAAQPWCNGRVGMIGGSGNGQCANMAYLARPPHLVVIGSGNTAGNTALDWAFENGVRRWLYNWCKHRTKDGRSLPEWPKPTLLNYDRDAWQKKVAEASEDNPIVYFIDDGWFNIFGDAAVDDFRAFGKNGKVYVRINARTHGGNTIRGKRFPSSNVRNAAIAQAPRVPSFDDILKGAEATAPSRILYYVTGDIMDDAAPGNCWKYTETWPPSNAPEPFYLHENGSLSQTAPLEKGKLTYAYDPNDPAPSIGGDFSYSSKPGQKSGPLDQRPLQERADVLRFVSEPLAEPLEIGGELRADLFISTDVPDTLFVVKVADVYPDGYEAILREGAFMGRFFQGLKKPQPLKMGQIYRLQFGLKNSAMVFNRGHRIAIYVTSSSSPAYEVHSNRYEPVNSYEDAPVAHTTIHLSEDHPSCVILPVTAPE